MTACEPVNSAGAFTATALTRQSMDRGPSYLRFMSDVLWVGAADGIKSLRLLLVTPMLTRLLGAEGYGIWIQIRITVMCAAPVALLGLQNAIVRFLGGEQDTERIRHGFTGSAVTVAVSGFTLAALLFILSRPLAGIIFQDAGAAALVRMAAVLVFLEALDQLALTYLQTMRQMGRRAAFIWLEVLVEVAIVALLASVGAQLTEVLLALISWKAMVVALKFVAIWSRIGLGLPEFRTISSYLAFGAPLLLSSLLFLVLNYGDRFLIASLMDVRAVGLYSVAYMLGSVLMTLLTPVDYVLYPTITAAWNRGDQEAVRHYLRHVLKYAFLLLAPVLCWLTAMSRPLLLLVATEEFLPAAASIPLIGAGFLLFGFGVAGERVLLLAKRTTLITAVYAVLVMLNLALNLVLIPADGIRGAALATLISFAAYAAAMLSIAQRHCRFSIEGAIVWKSLLAATAVAVPMHYARVESFAGIAVSLVGGGVTYLALLVLFRTFSSREAAFLLRLTRPWKAEPVLGSVGAGD